MSTEWLVAIMILAGMTILVGAWLQAWLKARDLEVQLGRKEIATYELAEALRLTREYVGIERLPALPGWEWYDALARHEPEILIAILEWQDRSYVMEGGRIIGHRPHAHVDFSEQVPHSNEPL